MNRAAILCRPSFLATKRTLQMSQGFKGSYASALGQSASASSSSATRNAPSNPPEQQNHRPVASHDGQSNGRPQHPTDGHVRRKRSPSPTHVPRTSAPEQDVYVLTFLTDKKHHQILTDMRKKYFPPRLNKLDAHLTLFHALPGSKLEDEILPFLEKLSGTTRQFPLQAASPFRLKHGIAIGVPKPRGGDAARDVHSQLRRNWSDFLSDQDAGGFRAHYTIMNKMDDDKKVEAAYKEVEKEWKGCPGTVEGLTLWRYDRGHWEFYRDFKLQQA